MARTKQAARKPKSVVKYTNNTKPTTKTCGGTFRRYQPREVGNQISVEVKKISNESEKDNFFQHRGSVAPNEPLQCSLVHAFNNAIGDTLIVPLDMYNARVDLLTAAIKEKVDVYMGTDETGAGDWPIEVLMCVLGYNFYKRCVSLKKVKFGGHKRRKRAGAMVAEAIKSHVSNGFDLIVELQFPTNGPSSHSKTKTDGSASSSAAPGPAPGRAPYEYWRDLPVSPLGERGHFIAVRNGLVFDSAAPAGDPPVAVKDYPLWTHTERVYRLHVCVAGAAPNSSTPTTAAGEGDSDEKKENEGDQVGVRREPGARDREGEEEEREYGEDVLGDGSDYWQDTVDLRSDDDEP